MSRKVTIDESKTIRNGAVTITIDAQPLTVELDAKELGKEPAEAIATAIGDGIKAITVMARNGKHRAFNNTGHLANGITAEPNGDGYDIVPPDGYLLDDAVFERLVELVPVIESPLEAPGVDSAISKTADGMVTT